VEAPEARARFSLSTVARMATVAGDGRPHLVPVTFALLPGDLLVTAVDHKPKRTTALRRLDNIAANPQVCLLVDEYADDWNTLWWVRADGRARVVSPDMEPQLRQAAIDTLSARYVQYAQRRPSGDLIVVEVERWSGWSG
jgi:PPOX class probable F420-dependent enzyme